MNVRFNHTSGFLSVSVLILLVACATRSGAKGDLSRANELLREGIAQKNPDRKKLIEAVTASEQVLTQIKTIDDFVFEARYLTHLQQLLLLEDSSLSGAQLSSAIKNYENLYSFRFSIEHKRFNSELLRYGLRSADEYAHRVSYYSFYCNQDVYLVADGKDTVRAAFVNFERTFDMSPKLNFTFVFEKKGSAPNHRLNFVFDDAVFDNGKLNFEFNYKSISAFDSQEIQKLL